MGGSSASFRSWLDMAREYCFSGRGAEVRGEKGKLRTELNMGSGLSTLPDTLDADAVKILAGEGVIFGQ